MLQYKNISYNRQISQWDKFALQRLKSWQNKIVNIGYACEFWYGVMCVWEFSKDYIKIYEYRYTKC